MKLLPHVKAAWLSALRSGDYQQTHYRLNTGDGYCCLGVLCDIAVKDGFGNWLPSESEGMNYEDPSGIWDDGLPPESVIQWAFGASASADESAFRVPIVIPGFERPENPNTHLADLNDQHGFTFDMIADVIEEHM